MSGPSVLSRGVPSNGGVSLLMGLPQAESQRSDPLQFYAVQVEAIALKLNAQVLIREKAVVIYLIFLTSPDKTGGFAAKCRKTSGLRKSVGVLSGLVIFLWLPPAFLALGSDGTFAGLVPATLLYVGGFWQFWMEYARHRSYLRHIDSGFAPGTQHLALLGAASYLICILGGFLAIILSRI